MAYGTFIPKHLRGEATSAAESGTAVTDAGETPPQQPQADGRLRRWRSVGLVFVATAAATALYGQTNLVSEERVEGLVELDDDDPYLHTTEECKYNCGGSDLSW